MKKLVTSYTFDASAQTIDAADFTSLEKIQLITNVTDQEIIYNFADTNKGGTLAGTVLTLEYDTTSMSDTDKLQIFVDDETTGATLPTGAATAAKQDTGNTSLATLAGAVSGTEVQVDVLTMPTTTVQATNLDIRDLTNADVVTAELSATDNAVLDAIAASVAAIDTDTTTIIGHVDGLETSNSAIQTAVQLLDDTVTTLGTDTYTEATSKGITIGAVRRDADTTLVNTTNEFGPLQMDANGRLKVEAFSGEALPVTDNASSLSVDWNGTQPVTGSGNATGALRVELANNGTGVISTVTNITNQGQIADDGTFTPASTRVNMAGFFADETATDSVDEGDGGAARMTLDRKQIVTPYVHAAAGGQTAYYNLDVDETEDAIKASAGKLYWIHVMNLSASVRYIKFYNATTANVTVGTTTPVLSFPIPTLATTNGAGFTIHFGSQGVQFDTAITVAATTGLADNNTGAPGANEVILNCGYA